MCHDPGVNELLAASVSPLVGRTAERTALRRALARARLVTVTGPGGTSSLPVSSTVWPALTFSAPVSVDTPAGWLGAVSCVSATFCAGLDLASGSGLVAIAAAKAGAVSVEANYIDDFALSAVALNAEANEVNIRIRAGDLLGGQDEGWDVVMAGDVSYERDMAAAMTGWLEGLARRGATVLIGDPGRSYLARDRLVALVTYEVPVNRTLEDADVKRTSVWGFAE